MPITKSAKKALRQSIRKAAVNKPIKTKAKTLLKKARKELNTENISKAFSALDKAGKKNLLPKNRISRLKSRLTKAANKLAK
ncbi:30S ribosomal protein S20 [Candidatus Beckwithbacteria bacterium]|nr:30S ribosomal protein S20 [Candidatus Beckwithbacteria bacterium]